MTNPLIDACLFFCDLPDYPRAGFANLEMEIGTLHGITKLHQVSVLPPAKSNSTPANAVTDVSIKVNILLNVNRLINSVAGKNIVINRVSDRLTFTAIPTTEPQVSVNSTISITTDRTADLAGKASFMVGRRRRFPLPGRADAPTSAPPLTT